jgi:hypothetical protein
MLRRDDAWVKVIFKKHMNKIGEGRGTMRYSMHGLTCSLSASTLNDLQRIIITNLHMLSRFASLIFINEGYTLGLTRIPVVGARTEHIAKVMKSLRNLLLAGLIAVSFVSNEVRVGYFLPVSDSCSFMKAVASRSRAKMTSISPNGTPITC